MPAVPSITIQEALTDIEQQFWLDEQALKDISRRFQELFHYGLANHGAEMAMIPTFVTGVPDGTETGTYLALDLGGTNLRVCEINLDGKGGFTMKQEKYKVSDALKRGPAKDLFDYMARSVDTFLTDYGTSSSDDELLMGFTFSFPVEQTAIDKGTLIHWTKGFDCPDAPGKDVVKLLQDALDRKHIKVRVNALVNDTVGALLARGYQTSGALLGAIFGTGTNGAYLEDITKVKKLNLPSGGPSHMVINTEWGGMDDERKVLPVTIFDNYVDRKSIRQRNHVFEKMISGMYLGEVARAVLTHLMDHLVLFKGFSSELFNTMYAFDTAYMSAIEADEEPASSPNCATRKVLIETMKVPAEHVSDEDVETVRKVCRIVGTRAARLSAVAVAAVLDHTGNAQSKSTDDQGANVGVDGSVIEFYPHFEERLREALRILLGEQGEKRVKIGLAKDGSGVGAALGALQAFKQEQSGHRVEI
ncbi:hypothetical protein IE53DRAFT_384167 [Violaceomyces palustris]|uniref:Uncharacterized protein n=1 Tax=Violaceomyces palustris TaxID=1673888 RepID=A0ACD0P5E5_9BASI|nr:hypothetical protein IE53DRAFT_384167 [Violaceomyces palustris]